MANEFKSGFVTFIGRPNVGKSTLMNRLIGQKIAITSSKPQTTRNRIQTVYTDERGQIIFLDTPGINKAKNKLGNYMLQVAERTLNEVDVVLWLVEPSTFIGGGEKYIIEQLSKIKTPIILVINKIDTLEDKAALLAVIAAWKERGDFDAIVPVSALNGDGLEELLTVLSGFAFESPHFFPDDATSDQTEQAVAAEVIREKMLLLLRQEIPHGIAVAIERMGERETAKGTILDIEANIYCERESHKGMVIGKQGAMLKQIASLARAELEQLFDTRVNLQCWVKVKEDWRNRQGFLNGLGYKLD